MYKYCSCIFLDKIRDNAMYAVSRSEHAMPGSCVILSSPFFLKIYSSFSMSVVSEKKLISLFKRMIYFFLSRAYNYLKMLF